MVVRTDKFGYRFVKVKISKISRNRSTDKTNLSKLDTLWWDDFKVGNRMLLTNSKVTAIGLVTSRVTKIDEIEKGSIVYTVNSVYKLEYV